MYQNDCSLEITFWLTPLDEFKVKIKKFLYGHHFIFAWSDTQYYPIKYIWFVTAYHLLLGFAISSDGYFYLGFIVGLRDWFPAWQLFKCCIDFIQIIIIKYMSSSILIIIKILMKLWPFYCMRRYSFGIVPLKAHLWAYWSDLMHTWYHGGFSLGNMNLLT